MADQTGSTVDTALEPKLPQKMIELSITIDQRGSTFDDKEIQESRQDEPRVQVKREWQPRTSDMWVQCETCKKWQMLPDDSNPAILPDKW